MTDTFQFTQEQLDFIRELAYEKFVTRGCEDGHDLEDWLSAEQEVLACSTDESDESCAPRLCTSNAAS